MNKIFKFLVINIIGYLTHINILHAIENKQNIMDVIIVTATKEEKVRSELAESIAVIDETQINNIAPTHPADLLNRISGVHINNIGGEGHMSAIRQPITTGGLYLFLEDGLPTRPTGFFNHNGLYEINLPQASKIEITKGPGSALYGSDAIGGIINSITKPSPGKKEIKLIPEYGSYGWYKTLLSAGSPINKYHGFRFDLNHTNNEGYREESEYNKISSTLRFDSLIKDHLALKTIISVNNIEQSGTSSLNYDDYLNDSKKNLFHNDIANRDVNALRISTEISYESDDVNLYKLTPFFRQNNMQLMPSWMISYDPNFRDYDFKSYGLLGQYRRKLSNISGELIAGIDIDYTPSSYLERDITVTKLNDIYTHYSFTGDSNYDFTADQTSISPYLHAEWQVKPKIRLVTGLRYDYFDIDYNNNLSISNSGPHVRAASQNINYDHLSPKLGLIYKYHNNHNIFTNYKNAFRVPSIGQLFRSASSVNTTKLKPVKSDSFEIGLRGILFRWLNYDTSLYHMITTNDIISILDVTDRKVQNAGKTKHQGIEISFNGKISNEWSFNSSFTYTKHKYEKFKALYSYPATTINYDGFTIGKAPKTQANLSLNYNPPIIKNLALELEWEHLGKYFTDETNTTKYGGHDLLNLRTNYKFHENIKIYGKILNIGNKLYSTYTSNQVGNPNIQYRPGNGRSLYLGLETNF